MVISAKIYSQILAVILMSQYILYILLMNGCNKKLLSSSKEGNSIVTSV